MTMLKNIFPQVSEIPKEWQLNEFIEQREYLVNGELRIWEGPMNEVVSPVSIYNGNSIEKNIIGTTPLLTQKESLEALYLASSRALSFALLAFSFAKRFCSGTINAKTTMQIPTIINKTILTIIPIISLCKKAQ